MNAQIHGGGKCFSVVPTQLSRSRVVRESLSRRDIEDERPSAGAFGASRSLVIAEDINAVQDMDPNAVCFALKDLNRLGYCFRNLQIPPSVKVVHMLRSISSSGGEHTAKAANSRSASRDKIQSMRRQLISRPGKHEPECKPMLKSKVVGFEANHNFRYQVRCNMKTKSLISR